MGRDETRGYDAAVARAVTEYLRSGEEAVLDALSPGQRVEAESKIALQREATRRELEQRRSTQAVTPKSRYGRQFAFIVVGFIVILICFWAVYALPKLA